MMFKSILKKSSDSQKKLLRPKKLRWGAADERLIDSEGHGRSISSQKLLLAIRRQLKKDVWVPVSRVEMLSRHFLGMSLAEANKSEDTPTIIREWSRPKMTVRIQPNNLFTKANQQSAKKINI